MSKKKSKYSKNETRAYWIGVGISMARHGDASEILDGKGKMSASAIAGYEADNYKDIGGKLAKRK